jgi:hypothetical protein
LHFSQFKSTTTYDTSGESTEPDTFVDSSYPVGYVVSISSRAVGVAKSTPLAEIKVQEASTIELQIKNKESGSSASLEIIDVMEDGNPSDDDFIDSGSRKKQPPVRRGKKSLVPLKRIPSNTSTGESRMHLLRRPKVLDLWYVEI